MADFSSSAEPPGIRPVATRNETGRPSDRPPGSWPWVHHRNTVQRGHLVTFARCSPTTTVSGRAGPQDCGPTAHQVDQVCTLGDQADGRPDFSYDLARTSMCD